MIVLLLFLRQIQLTMKDVLSTIRIQVNEKIYVKDPETSTLGRKIIQESILLIDEIGFDNFTFKKLGIKINSNESSIYRYFENKHKLLLYLSSWYWSWIEYKLFFATTNVDDSIENQIDNFMKHTGDGITFLPDDNEELFNRLMIILAAMKEGHRSSRQFNEVNCILKRFLEKKIISKKDY